MVAALLAAEPKVKVIGPYEAAALAAADIVAVPEHDQCFQMYAFFSESNDLKADAFDKALNTGISHASTLYKTVRLADGYLVRFDVRRFVPQAVDYARFCELREFKLAVIEPDFHKAELIFNKHGIFQKQACPVYLADDGKQYHYKTVPLDSGEQFALGSNVEALLLLHSLTKSNVPIVRAEWFQNLILATLEVGKAKGLYYEFQGVKGLKISEVFAKFGVDEKTVAKLRSDQRAAIFHSGVTDRERRFDLFPTLGTRPEVGPGFGTATYDTALGDVDPEQSPLRNLLDFLFTATEFFFLKPNGMQFAGLGNNQDQLQDSAPEDVAHDSTVPHPSPQTLQPIISCMGCHGPFDGYVPFKNDVLTLYQKQLPGGLRGNIFDDLDGKHGVDDTLDRLHGLYSGDMQEPLRLLQDAHARATFKLTGRTVAEIDGELVRSRNSFVFGRWNAKRVLYDCGFYVDEDEMLERFAELVPPMPKYDGRSSPEDPSILGLRAGLDLSLAQWQHVKPDVLLRIRIGQKQEQKQ